MSKAHYFVLQQEVYQPPFDAKPFHCIRCILNPKADWSSFQRNADKVWGKAITQLQDEGLHTMASFAILEEVPAGIPLRELVEGLKAVADSVLIESGWEPILKDGHLWQTYELLFTPETDPRCVKRFREPGMLVQM